MSLGATYLPDFDQEMGITRRVLERVPSDKGTWKPHPKSFSMAHLAQLVSWMPAWVADTLRHDALDLDEQTGYSIKTTEVLLKEFDANVASAKAAIAEIPDATWKGDWSLIKGGMKLWTAPRTIVVRNHLNHLIHHRAQLTVYLRLCDVPVPATYGPSADEQPARM